MLDAFLKDVRDASFQIVLHLDNIDELRHEYKSEQVLREVRQDVEVVLELKDAPVGLVIGMRTYYGGVLSRDISRRRNLKKLPNETLQQLLTTRLKEERAEVQNFITQETTKKALNLLFDATYTPLSLLTWFQFLIEEDEDFLTTENLAEGLDEFLDSHYSTIPKSTLFKVADCFTSTTDRKDREDILNACGSNEAILAQLQDRQAILPVDFWHPHQFTLDPELHFLLFPKLRQS